MCARVFLRDIKTGQFFQSPDKWIAPGKDATEFANPTEAIRLALDMGFSQVEIFIPFEDSRYDIHFPLPASLAPGWWIESRSNCP